MPSFIKYFIIWVYSNFYILKTKIFLEKEYPNNLFNNEKEKNIKPRILFYHVSGLSFAGTEKFLQILAKHLNPDIYDVYFMYSPKPRSCFGDEVLDGRLNYLKNTSIRLIPFNYRKLDNKYPYFIHKMSPTVFEVIKRNNIDLLITAGAGYSEFPFNVVKNIPIVLINIFGSLNIQKNILYNVCVSETVSNKIKHIVPEEKIKVMYNQSENPSKNSFENGKILRKKLNIKEDEVVFGRIGRASDNIFDSIGIMAFKQVVKEVSNIHYLIMSPPPILKKIVKEHKISNVHFLGPSANEEDIWAFHQAIDVLAHFRKDGESCGLNIVEAMLCGKPIISHKSKYWNAHLEYLDSSFSRIADVDNIQQYIKYMKEFISFKKDNKILGIGQKAKEKAEKLFLIKNNINQFEKWVNKALYK